METVANNPGDQLNRVAPEEPLVKKIEEKQSNLGGFLLPTLVILIILAAGGATGYFLANRGSAVGSVVQESKTLPGGAKTVASQKEVGIEDTTAFPDTSSGKIEINDNKSITEGTHKLIRPGGESQTAYLTSSVVDLGQFVGKCVQVWGQTFAAQKAAWLMDVGRVKLLENCPEGI